MQIPVCFARALGALALAWTTISSAAGADIPAHRAPIVLFNGHDLNNFDTFLKSHGLNNDPDQVFRVEKGRIHISGKEFGYIITKREFANYYLRAEFKWGEGTYAPRQGKARDSGILYNVRGPQKVWPTSIEFQILEGGTGDFWLTDGAALTANGERTTSPEGKAVKIDRIGKGSSQNVTGYRDPVGEVEKPHGEWNVLELVVQGDHLKQFVNGKLANQGSEAFPSSGKILFQSEGAEVFFRNIKLFPLKETQAAGNPFTGRWDINVTTPNAAYPDWMEFVEKDSKPEVRIQPRGGSVRPASNIKVEGAHLSLTLLPAAANRPETTWELTADGDHLTGTEKRGGTLAGQLAGVRAPTLKRAPPKAWSAPEPLFNGKDLTGWEPSDAANNHWIPQDGALLNETKGANLRTTRKFDDFKLHIEYNCPEGGNSGVYLRGRYEVQVEYEPTGRNDPFHSLGSIYGFISPKIELPRKQGEWESFDITLVGRNVTVVRDGVTIIDRQEIPGITGGALDSEEAQPGPIYIQGDHTGGMKYRNITISTPKD